MLSTGYPQQTFYFHLYRFSEEREMSTFLNKPEYLPLIICINYLCLKHHISELIGIEGESINTFYKCISESGRLFICSVQSFLAESMQL